MSYLLPVPAARFSPNGPSVPPECLNWQREAHWCAFEARFSSHLSAFAPCFARRGLCAWRYALMSPWLVARALSADASCGSVGAACAARAEKKTTATARNCMLSLWGRDEKGKKIEGGRRRKGECEVEREGREAY
jgi:hypothetical protein